MDGRTIAARLLSLLLPLPCESVSKCVFLQRPPRKGVSTSDSCRIACVFARVPPSCLPSCLLLLLCVVQVCPRASLSSFASLHSVSCPVVSPWPLVKFRSALRRRPLVSSSTLCSVSCVVSRVWPVCFCSAPCSSLGGVLSRRLSVLCPLGLAVGGRQWVENFWDVAGSVYVCMCVDVCMCDGVTRVRMELGVVAW